MFWLISYSGVQLLIFMWLAQVVYTAYVTMKGNVNNLIKVIVIILLFVSCYFTIDVSKNWIGTPSFTEDEVIGTLSGYDQFIVEGKHMLAIMITTKSGPFMFAVQYNPKLEKELNTSMQRRSATGKPTLIRKRSAQQIEIAKSALGDQSSKQESNVNKAHQGDGGDSPDGEMEFYDFTDQLLTPKSTSTSK